MYQILLAEDEDTLRSILKVFFEKNGFGIDTVDKAEICRVIKQRFMRLMI